MIDPFPNAPGVTDLGDGRKMVETKDRGHCYRMVEPDGKVSVVIAVNTPTHPKPKPIADRPFQVRETDNGQEIIDADGYFVARTVNPDMARHICNLLIVFVNMKRSKHRNE